MAVAFDNATLGSTFEDVTSNSFSHEVSGSDRLLVVAVHHKQNDEPISGITYNGTALTFIAKRPLAGEADDDGQPQVDMWYLVNPDTGTNTVAITWNSGAGAEGRAGAVSYTGVEQTDPFIDTVETASDTTTVSDTINVTAENALVVSAVVIDDSVTLSPDTGQNERYEEVAIGGAGGQKMAFSDLLDSGTTGNETMLWTADGEENWAIVVAAFKQAEGGGDPDPVPLRSLMGVGS